MSVQDERASAAFSQAWQEHRPYLVDLAFRMLGDIGAAEDVVQDAFARLLATGAEGVDDARGWLIVVTSRLCLDQIRSARVRRERAHDAAEIEFVGPAALPLSDPAALSDPAERATLDDEVSLAMLAVLQRLSPAERVVFVLHDVFRMPFEEIASTVGRTAPTCRQLARRARQKIAAAEGGSRFEVLPAEHRQVTERFIHACSNGDLTDLVALLDADAWGEVDLGPLAEPPGGASGAERVARNLIHYWGGRSATLVTHPVGGMPAILGFHQGRLSGVLVLRLSGEVIQAVHVIADPAKLDLLNAQLTQLR
jgi:RNA polymerase sigma-70 factor (ECF subfamily)